MSIERPRIALLATGGTIVSSGKSPDQMTGYGIENFRVTDLVAAVPGIEKIAEIEPSSPLYIYTLRHETENSCKKI